MFASNISILFKELCFWLLTPVTFILYYQVIHHSPEIVIFQHLLILCLVAACSISFRLFLHCLNLPNKFALLLSSTIYACIAYIFIVYYVVVIVGLKVWGHVITRELLISYLSQLNGLSESLGISIWLIALSLISLFLIFLIVIYSLLKRFSYRPKKVKSNLITILVFTLFLYLSYQLHEVILINNVASEEPISLTLYSGKPNELERSFSQGLSLNHKLVHSEENARLDYIKNLTVNKSSKKYKNIVIILSDALRYDHMGIYGYSRDTTPHLNNLASNSSLIKILQAYSTCGETTCAHSSLFGSRFIHETPENLLTLQEVIKLNGYKTHMIISGDHVNFYNIRKIYGEVDSYYDGSMAKKYYINDDTLVLDKTKSLPNWDGQPTFLHYHLLSNHVLGKRFNGFQLYQPSKSYIGRTSGKPNQAFTNFYDNGVLQTDSVINTILNTLKDKKYLDNTLVIITADHGESLGEHNLISHTNSVYEELLHIPLLFIPYGYESKISNNYSSFMQLIDLAPTILNEIGIDAPVTWTGEPIQQSKKRQFSYFMMQPFEGLYDHRNEQNLWKYWRNTETKEEFVFNIRHDPKEKDNVIFKVPNHLLQEWRTTISDTKNR